MEWFTPSCNKIKVSLSKLTQPTLEEQAIALKNYLMMWQYCKRMFFPYHWCMQEEHDEKWIIASEGL